MVSEDLYVSAEQVRVRYVFRNRTPRAGAPHRRLPAARSRPRRRRRGRPRPSLGDFSTRVDGRPVRMQVERRAFAARRRSQRAAAPARHPVRRRRERRRSRAGQRGARPAAAGASSGGSSGSAWSKAMTTAAGAATTRAGLVKETWHWEQVFPAGRDLVVEHSYAPGTGGTRQHRLRQSEIRGERLYGRERDPALLHRRRLPRRGRADGAPARRSSTSPSSGSATSSPPAATGARRSAISGWWSTRGGRRIWSASAGGRAPDQPDPVRDAPPQLAAGPRSRRPDPGSGARGRLSRFARPPRSARGAGHASPISPMSKAGSSISTTASIRTSCNLFELIDVRMGDYIQRLLGVDAAEARRVQKGFFHAHGTTLAGLMANARRRSARLPRFRPRHRSRPARRRSRSGRGARPAAGAQVRLHQCQRGLCAPRARPARPRQCVRRHARHPRHGLCAQARSVRLCGDLRAARHRSRRAPCSPTTWPATSRRPRRSA